MRVTMIYNMRNIEIFTSKQMYPYLSLDERKVAEFYHNIDRRRWLVWLKWLIFINFSGQLMVSLLVSLLVFTKFSLLGFFLQWYWITNHHIWNSLMIFTIAMKTEIWGTLDDTANCSNMAWLVLEGERGGWQTQSQHNVWNLYTYSTGLVIS